VAELNYSHSPDIGQQNRESFGRIRGLLDGKINLLTEQKIIY
jgi:hypothetical protein